MRQQILNLKKKLLIVERNSESIFVNDLKEIPFRLGKMFKLTDITEDEFAKWVKSNILYDYADYTNNEICILPTAKESFFSYLESQGIYFENPLGKIEPELLEDDLWGDMAHDSQVYAGILYKKDKWQEAEQKVWNKDLIYVFEII